MMILATLSADALWHYIVDGVLATMAIVAVIISILVYRGKAKVSVSPNPLNVNIQKQRQARAAEVDCRNRHAEAMAMIKAVETANHAEHGRIYDQIDLVERRSEDKLSAAVSEMNKTLQDMPFKIIGILRSAGQIKDAHNESNRS